MLPSASFAFTCSELLRAFAHFATRAGGVAAPYAIAFLCNFSLNPHQRLTSSHAQVFKWMLLLEFTMDLQYEFAALFAITALGTSVFARFEVESPVWRKLLRWVFVATVMFVSYSFVGHWAIAIVVGLGALGATLHFIWCARTGIDPISAAPRRRYYELRGWPWPEA